MMKVEWKFPCLFLAAAAIAFSCYSPPDTASAGKVSAQDASTQYLLEDVDFEDAAESGLPVGWAVVPHHREKGATTRDDRNAYSGRHSLKISPNRRNDAEGFGVFKMLNAPDLKGNDVTISGYVRAEGLGKSNVAVVLKTNKANWIKLPSETKGRFVPFSKTISVADSIPEAALLVMVGGTRGSVWLDDLKVLVKGEFAAPARDDSPTPSPGYAATKPEPVRLGDLPATAAILFVSNRDTKARHHDIYAMDADGGNVTRITFTKQHHFLVGMDSSRRYIVSSRVLEDTHKPKGLGVEDRRSLWVLDLQKKTEVRLTDPRHHAEGDSFSPDGQWIVFFMKFGDHEQMDIYKIRRDGSQLTRLTHTPDAMEADPSWSNGGRRIAFTQMDFKASKSRVVLKTMNTDGGDVVTVYDDPDAIGIKGVFPPGIFDPHFSPDDQWIVFEQAIEDNDGNAGSGIWHIFKVSIDGRRLVDLSLAGGHTDRAEYLPSYSEDGRSIVYGSIYQAARSRDSHIDIFTMNSNDGSPRRLTRHPANDMFPIYIHSAR
jgi:hypothetical protein